MVGWSGWVGAARVGAARLAPLLPRFRPPPHTHAHPPTLRLMAKCGVLENLLLKEHTHTFVNAGGDVRELDFRFYLGDTKVGGWVGGCDGWAGE